jgi:hypothetical protein
MVDQLVAAPVRRPAPAAADIYSFAVQDAKEAIYRSLMRQQTQLEINNMILMKQKKTNAVVDVQGIITSSHAWQDSLARKALAYERFTA